MQLQHQKIRGTKSSDVGNNEKFRGAVGGRVHRVLLRKLFDHVEVVELGGEGQSVDVFVLAADQPDGVIVITIHRMQGFHGALGAKIAARGTQVIVVQVPDHGGPGVVQHPLDYAGGLIFVAAVSLVHRAYAFVSLEL